jgi:hypothetical protein
MSLREILEPYYARFLYVASFGRGLRWHVDGQTVVRIDPRCRWLRSLPRDAPTASYLRARVRPGDDCVEVGAHVGYYALHLAQWTAPNGRIAAFEPNPLAREVLASNVRINGLADRITVETGMRTLDAYCTARALMPRWVLINAEGYELDVLTGASGLLVDRHVSFIIAMHPDLWSRGRQATAVQFEMLLRTCGRTAVPLTGQQNPLEDYGTIAIP